jgi:hypothetical protein
LEDNKPKKAEIGKLTKQNLENIQGSKDFSVEKADAESIILLDQTAPSPKAETGLKDSMVEPAEQKDIVVETKTNQVKAFGEQITHSKSTSQLGGQESENMRRLQEALQSKKEINNELNLKIL